ncbi:MAG: hypothetical protein P9L99_06265 [Candidatus Lernaella stagnicola]|nr:hypothetical protein [Candidatus Lernaella stagnicola]
MAMSRVHVQHRDGSPARHVRVVLGFSGIAGGMTKPAFTDGSGDAVVEHSSTGRATVYVSGSDCGSFHAPGTYAATV